jgi:DNA-binding MarR family transcriptional regulator/GNAT superfamily N-acetyltransferase
MSEKDFLRELGMLAVVTRLKRVGDAMLHDGRRMYKKAGLKIEPNWFVIFLLLKEKGELSVTEIANQIRFSHPSVISIVNGMIKSGYLKEKRCEGDSRRRLLSLTSAAKRELPKFERHWRQGKSVYKELTSGTDILAALDLIEDRLAEKGFAERTAEKVRSETSVEVVGFRKRLAPEFARLNYEWIAKDYAVEDHDHDQLDHPKEYIIDRGGQIFFALVDGEAAGTVAVINAGDGLLELAKMAVSPDFRGRNISDSLMQASVDHARKVRAHTIFLESNTKQFAAIKLYRKWGFVETPLDPNSLFERANIRMELAITPS